MLKQALTHFAWVLALFFLFVGCSDEDNSAEKQSKNDIPTQQIRNAHLLRSVSGQVDIELSSPLIEIYSYDTSKMCAPQGLEVFFLNPDLTKKAFLRADYAVNYNNSNLYYIRDSVVIIDFKSQDTFYCKDLYWVKDSALLRTDLPIRRHSSGGMDYGDGLRATDSFDSVRIKNPSGSQKVEE